MHAGSSASIDACKHAKHIVAGMQEVKAHRSSIIVSVVDPQLGKLALAARCRQQWADAVVHAALHAHAAHATILPAPAIILQGAAGELEHAVVRTDVPPESPGALRRVSEQVKKRLRWVLQGW